MRLPTPLLAIAICVAAMPAIGRENDVEPHMHIAADAVRTADAAASNIATPGSGPAGPVTALPVLPAATDVTVALTLDACMGGVDYRILGVLLEKKIPATIFVTRRWLQRNPAALAVLMAHPDLFEIENHGAEHVPPITDHPTMFGLKTAGTIEAVRAEVQGGGAAILAATGRSARWFRGATARYSRDAVAEIAADGYLLAGYSLNADMGTSLPAASVERRLEAARNGDVIIAHINQPKRASGGGVAAGILALHARGVRFVRLEDARIEASR